VNSSIPSTLKVSLNDNSSRFDISLIVIWLIAIVTIILGALWTKLEFGISLTKLEEEAKTNNVDSNENLVDSKSVATINAADVSELEANRNLEASPTSKRTQEKNNEEQITTISVGYVSIFVLLVFVVGILLLLYFFYDYMSKIFRFSEKIGRPQKMEFWTGICENSGGIF
jgi:hypothetical protein